MGGTPHLDNEHTVFGRLVDGWEVLDQLSQVPPMTAIGVQRLEMGFGRKLEGMKMRDSRYVVGHGGVRWLGAKIGRLGRL